MHIREASSEDLDQILELFEKTVEHINVKDYSEQQIEVWKNAKDKKIWLEKIAQQSFYVAMIGEQIVGFSSVASDGYLHFMYVHHQHQRKGIAYQLLRQIEHRAKQLGRQRIWSSVSITAQPFFSKHGFQQFDEEHKTVSGVPFQNALMEKSISR